MDSEKIKLKSVKDAVRFLTAKGWRASGKSIYRHIQQGKLAKGPWTADALDFYSAKYLQPRVDLQPTKKAGKALQSEASQLIQVRKEKIEVETKLKKLELKVKSGDLILEEKVKVHFVDRIREFRQALLDQGRRLSLRCANKPADQIQIIMEDDNRRILEAYSRENSITGKIEV